MKKTERNKTYNRHRYSRPPTTSSSSNWRVILLFFLILLGLMLLVIVTRKPKPLPPVTRNEPIHIITNPWSIPKETSTRGVYKQERTCEPLEECMNRKIKLERETKWVPNQSRFEFEVKNPSTGCKEIRRMHSCVEQDTQNKVDDSNCLMNLEDNSKLLRVECESSLAWYIIAAFFIAVLGVGVYQYDKWRKERQEENNDTKSEDKPIKDKNENTEVTVHVLLPVEIKDKNYKVQVEYNYIEGNQFASLQDIVDEDSTATYVCKQIIDEYNTNNSENPWIPGSEDGKGPTDERWTKLDCSTRLCKFCFSDSSGLYSTGSAKKQKDRITAACFDKILIKKNDV